MVSKFYMILCILTVFHLKNLSFQEFNYDNYQDIIINGKVIKSGNRECQKRYVPIKNFLKSYQRPFTVLDIGASEGYFLFNMTRKPHVF